MAVRGSCRGIRTSVLMGGISSEREVSLRSGRAVCQALKEAGYTATPYDVIGPDLDGLQEQSPDVVFVALHGRFGEDGQVQRLLEMRGLPYTGSDPVASCLSMDKAASKRLFVRSAVPTPDYYVVDGQDSPSALARQAAQMGYPVVCKPADGGSSLGVSIVRRESELMPALGEALCYGRAALVERYIRGRELTVGILDERPLPLIELEAHREFFDYNAKYHDEATKYIVPVTMIESVYRKAQEVSMRAFDCLGLRDFGRVDLLYGYDGRIYVLEVNAIPGLTPRSLLPMAARYAGIDYVELCDRMVVLAARRATAGRSLRKAG